MGKDGGDHVPGFNLLLFYGLFPSVPVSSMDVLGVPGMTGGRLGWRGWV